MVLHSDNFNDNVRDTGFWDILTVGPAAAYERNQRVELECLGEGATCGYVTRNAHDLSESQIEVEASNINNRMVSLLISPEKITNARPYEAMANYYRIMKFNVWQQTVIQRRRLGATENIASGPFTALSRIRINISDGYINFYENDTLIYREAYLLHSYQCYVYVFSRAGAEEARLYQGTDWFDNFHGQSTGEPVEPTQRIKGRRVLCVVYNEMNLNLDFQPVTNLLRTEGAILTYAAYDMNPVVPYDSAVTVQPDMIFSEIDASRFDALFITGGYITYLNDTRNQEYFGMIRDFVKLKKVISALCCGPAALGRAEVVDRIRGTGTEICVREVWEAAGGIYVDDATPTLRDSNFVTGQTYAVLEFTELLIQTIAEYVPQKPSMGIGVLALVALFLVFMLIGGRK